MGKPKAAGDLTTENSCGAGGSESARGADPKRAEHLASLTSRIGLISAEVKQ
jgi:hypothetical protein